MDGGGGGAGRGDETLQLSVIIESSSAPRHQNPFFNWRAEILTASSASDLHIYLGCSPKLLKVATLIPSLNHPSNGFIMKHNSEISGARDLDLDTLNWTDIYPL